MDNVQKRNIYKKVSVKTISEHIIFPPVIYLLLTSFRIIWFVFYTLKHYGSDANIYLLNIIALNFKCMLFYFP
jgi:hypothetical protein